MIKRLSQICYKQKTSGFTLVELVITIAVLSILMVGVLTLINPVSEVKKGLDAKRKSDLAQIQRLLELYYHDNGEYPSSLPFGESWDTYSNKLPNDPSPPKKYAYRGTGQSYYLYASLDQGILDKSICKSDGSACDNASGLTCGETNHICNYGVGSTDILP